MKATQSNDTSENNGREESLLPDAGLDEEDVVEESVEDEEEVDDTAQDSMVAIYLFMRRVEDVGEGIEILESQEILNGHLGCCDDSESLCEMEIICFQVS